MEGVQQWWLWWSMVDSPHAAAWRELVPSQMRYLLTKKKNLIGFLVLPMTQKKMHLDTDDPKQRFGKKHLLQINQNRKMHPLRKREVALIFSTDLSAALFYTVCRMSSQCYSASSTTGFHVSFSCGQHLIRSLALTEQAMVLKNLAAFM